MRRLIGFLCLSLISVAPGFAQTTGKIAGTVTDAKTGEKLVGVTVVVQGTTLGAATDINGYYAVLNLTPGTYTLKASMVGYATVAVENVQVAIDQTTTIDIKMSEAAITTNQVTVVARRPVIQKDVSASTVNITPSEVASIPAVTVTGAVALQAGIQSNTTGLIIRGGGSDQTAFNVDGFRMQDPRSDYMITNISLTSVKDIQVQTGGFNAEYGNIRSGEVNVTTNSGSRSHYTISVLSRIAPPQAQNFGGSINGLNTYFVRPYLDPGVAYYGTGDGAWNALTQSQYQRFDGWLAESQKSLASGSPSQFLSPVAAQKLWEWDHRKDFSIYKPNYDIDASLGGPFPVLSKDLGNLRFWASYVQRQSMYMVPLTTDAYESYNGSLKLNADVGPGMELMLEGMTGQQSGTGTSGAGLYGTFENSSQIASVLSNVSYIDTRMYSNWYWNPTKENFTLLGARFSDVINPSTYYDVILRETGTQYHTTLPAGRDTSLVQFGNYYSTNYFPFGYWPAAPSYSSYQSTFSNNGLGMSDSRDTSSLAEYNLKFDLTSQIDDYNQVKTGLEFDYTDNNVNYGLIDSALTSDNNWSHWHTFPIRASVYLQDKIEFEGMIANLGVRVDASHAGGLWYNTNDPYSLIFSGIDAIGLDTTSQSPTKTIVMVEPRLGISFPVTVDSKLYFNYGHFYSMPTPEDLFLIQRNLGTNNVSLVADPNAPLPRTIAYELGFEQSLFNQYLIHIAGYYKDVTNERTTTSYHSSNSLVNYSLFTDNLYEDIRGFEITLSKNSGDWIRGFIDYTYMVSSYGRFGYANQYQSPADQRAYDLQQMSNPPYGDLFQSKPMPQPYATLNLDLFTPHWLGPNWSGAKPLADWHVNVLGNWSAGPWFTWSGGQTIPGIQNNVEWEDYLNFNLRISRGFHFDGVDLNVFADIYNIFNYKYMSYLYGFVGGGTNDFTNYMESLHLPSSVAGDPTNEKFGYVNTPGNDRPGEYQSSNKPYIRMPLLWQLSMLNPRTVYYGIRFTYNIP